MALIVFSIHWTAFSSVSDFLLDLMIFKNVSGNVLRLNLFFGVQMNFEKDKVEPSFNVIKL